MTPRVLIAGLATIAALFCTTACSGSVSVGKTVKQAELEKQINDKLIDLVGSAPDSIECPEKLKAEVGATVECSLTTGSDTYAVSVEATSVDGTDVGFDFEVADQPTE